jgi:single-strand DNA-binding protein
MIIVQVAGHLGSDPEVRFTPSNQKVTSFRVAANIKRGDKEKTVWWRITCWGDRFDKRLAYLRKGSAVIVIGEMGIPEIYTDKSGNQQISLEITAEIVSFSPFGKGTKTGAEGTAQVADAGDGGAPSISMAQTSSYKPMGVMPGAGQANFAEDDIPF